MSDLNGTEGPEEERIQLYPSLRGNREDPYPWMFECIECGEHLPVDSETECSNCGTHMTVKVEKL